MEANLSSGAHPTATFPNQHLAGFARSHSGDANWSAPESDSALAQLQRAVQAEDWANSFAEGKTKFQAQASWSAGPERCSILQCLCAMNKASRVLEVGSFCGVATLAMAEAIPSNGEVVSLELDPYFVQLGEMYRVKSESGRKVSMKVGPAAESLEELAGSAKAGQLQPFDFVVVDSDKTNIQSYFDLLWKTPGMLSDRAVVCVDTTPFKGQAPIRYTKFGQEDKWECSSGEDEIRALRKAVANSEEFKAHEFSGLLVVQKK
jgi:predicted O-methyltransferase YrrM